MEKITSQKKIDKVLKALQIIKYSIKKEVSIATASKKHNKDRRFVYDVNRRWVKKNNAGVPIGFITEFKKLFKPKSR